MVPSKNQVMVVVPAPGRMVACATERPRFRRHSTVGSSYPLTPPIYNAAVESKFLACGCHVETSRDFLGRVVGRILEKHPSCQVTQHAPGVTVVMPGRENARPE
jgi:hypothetical protein